MMWRGNPQKQGESLAELWQQQLGTHNYPPKSHENLKSKECKSKNIKIIEPRFFFDLRQ